MEAAWISSTHSSYFSYKTIIRTLKSKAGKGFYYMNKILYRPEFPIFLIYQTGFMRVPQIP